MQVLETPRLILRHANFDDAPFIFDLLTDQTFIDNIADKGVKNLDDARNYISDMLLKSYKNNGFGLFLTELKKDNTPIGLCGLVKRDTLDCPDVGYAFLPQFTGQGYASESAKAVMIFGASTLGISRIVGMTSSTNKGSIKVLEKLGLHFEKNISHNGEETVLYVPD
jgi:ribosomal-protein-alanine N-acetyltransferase